MTEARTRDSRPLSAREPDDADRTLGRSRRALALLLLLLVVAFTAQTTADRATWMGLEGPRCPLGALLGQAACPGCGLTRSVCLAAHGHWRTSVRVHPAGIWVLGLALASALVHGHALWRRRRTRAHLAALTMLQRAFSGGVLVGFVIRIL